LSGEPDLYGIVRGKTLGRARLVLGGPQALEVRTQGRKRRHRRSPATGFAPQRNANGLIDLARCFG
jgi:hypothetical protein